MTHLRLFVATDGNDNWSGRLAAPNREKTDGPFATLGRARDAIREERNAAENKAAAVIVRGGKYFLDKTLVLGPQDSGTRDAPVTYTAHPGEKPILSGGRKISGFRPYKDKILQCAMPETRGGSWKFRQLFLNGHRQIRARYPKHDPQNPLYGGWAYPQSLGDQASYVSFKYKPTTFPRRWEKPTQAEVYMVHRYGVTNIIPIKAIDEENSVITLTHDAISHEVYPWFIAIPLSPHYRFYVENVLEELDQPGEWCLDTEEGILYFWPPESIEHAEVVAPALDCLIHLHDASWITISGLTFTETTSGDDMHRQGYEGYGAMFPAPCMRYCGEALRLKGAQHCTIEHNHFREVGGNAIYLEDYNVRNTIKHNEISHAGACGVVLIGSRYSHPVPHHPIYNEVVDNHIHHCGVFDKYVAGVFLGLCDGNVIAHNSIEHMPHHAINLGNSGYGRNILEYNEIRYACLETYDNGAINCWMDDPHGHIQKHVERCGHLIRYNLVADTLGCIMDERGNLTAGGEEAYTKGIYLDGFCSNCFVYGNIIVRGGWEGGIRLNGGKNNMIENNIIVDGKRQLGTGSAWNIYAPQMTGFLTGNRYSRNIFYRSSSDGEAMYNLKCWVDDRVLAECDYNLFFNEDGGDYTVQLRTDADGTVVPLSFVQWQEEGYDVHSAIADPLFVDAKNDDYRLKPDSPAFGLGFQPIDTSQIGVRDTK